MKRANAHSFFVVLPGKILEIPQDSNLAWLTLFYALPKELVEKRPAYFEIPRKDGIRRDIPGDWSNYSGDFPLWRLSYEIQKHFRNQFETVMEWSFQRLFLMDDRTELPWLSYKHFGNMVGNLTDKIVAEQNWQPMIDEIWNNRQVSDYTGKNLQKRDFMRSWDHSRTVQHISIEDMMENGVSIDGEQLYEMEDPRGEFESKMVSEVYIEQFKEGLTKQDAKILQMRCDGHSLEEIAHAVGFKTAGAVSKHIQKIAESYEAFVSKTYSQFLDEHTK